MVVFTPTYTTFSRSYARKKRYLWGCANRIVNGRRECDSHHVNEDTLQHTYAAAIGDMFEDAEEIMAAVKDSAGLVMEPVNKGTLFAFAIDGKDNGSFTL